MTHQDLPAGTGKQRLSKEILAAVLLATLIVASRIFVDVPNFKPVMAIALLSGFLFRHRLVGLAGLITGMLISDIVIGFYDVQVAIVVYVALACPIVFGLLLRRWKENILQFSAGVIGMAGLAAVNFYLMTTLAVWCCFEWYPNDLTGLGMALLAGLPFLKWSMLGNVVFSTILFGGYLLARYATCVMENRAIAQKVYAPARKR